MKTEETINEEIKAINKKILKYEHEIKSLESQENKKFKNEERRKRTKQLIQYGTIFEIAGLLKADYTTLLAYVMRFNKINENDMSFLKNKGLIFLEERKESQRKITDEEIHNLLNLGKEKNVDVVRLSQFHFKKNLLENLSKKQYDKLLTLLSLPKE